MCIRDVRVYVVREAIQTPTSSYSTCYHLQESIDQVEQHARQLVNDMEDVKLKMGDSVDRIQGLEDKLAKIAERLNVHMD